MADLLLTFPWLFGFEMDGLSIFDFDHDGVGLVHNRNFAWVFLRLVPLMQVIAVFGIGSGTFYTPRQFLQIGLGTAKSLSLIRVAGVELS